MNKGGLIEVISKIVLLIIVFPLGILLGLIDVASSKKW